MSVTQHMLQCLPFALSGALCHQHPPLYMFLITLVIALLWVLCRDLRDRLPELNWCPRHCEYLVHVLCVHMCWLLRLARDAAVVI